MYFMSIDKMKIIDEMGKNEFVKFFVKFFPWKLTQKDCIFASHSGGFTRPLSYRQ